KLDPDGVGRAIANAEERRAAGMATLARRLRAQKLLRPGLTAARAAHIFWIFASFDAYDLLATGRGLPPNEIIELLVEGAEHSLLAEV
ncbi:MAG: TetR/AcrR family transcriptional regulator, partial [Gaiellales bacterium]